MYNKLLEMQVHDSAFLFYLGGARSTVRGAARRDARRAAGDGADKGF